MIHCVINEISFKNTNESKASELMTTQFQVEFLPLLFGLELHTKHVLYYYFGY